MSKNKFYVVWIGREQGIFDSWEECKKQIDGFAGAKYKG
ncbi:MAG: RNase H1/viroplasmin domain-containing protein, partial [Bacteroidales bacterium]|nr:RNase H1/viroplasmin domain-containing protein [Bacteroidales bacterium]